MYLRPQALNDTVIDFTNFGAGAIYVTTGLNPNDHALQYMMNGVQMITMGGATTSNYSVQKLGTNAAGYVFKRPITTPGLYYDVINYYNKIVNLNPTDPNYNLPRPYITESDTYKYFVFQQAVAIVKVAGQSIVRNQIAMMSVGDSITVDGSLSRGCELGYNMQVYKRNSFGLWVLGVEDSDFSVVPSDTTNNYYTITPLVAAEFKVVCRATGYNSFNNPFGSNNDVRENVSDNYDAFSFIINSGVPTVIDTINLPQIQADVQAYLDSHLNPIGYTNFVMTVNADILYNTGNWMADMNPVVPTEAQWIELLQDNCNIQLVIYDGNNNNAQIGPAYNGFGPHTVFVSTATNCIFKYLVTIK